MRRCDESIFFTCLPVSRLMNAGYDWKKIKILLLISS